MLDKCIFCRIVKKEIPAEFVAETESFMAFPDVHPRTKGHTLIVPRKHFVNVIDMPAAYGEELMDIIKRVAEKRIKEGAEGFNLVNNCGKSAGQVVMHCHFHLIPRKKDEEVGWDKVVG